MLIMLYRPRKPWNGNFSQNDGSPTLPILELEIRAPYYATYIC